MRLNRGECPRLFDDEQPTTPLSGVNLAHAGRCLYIYLAQYLHGRSPGD